MFKCRTNDNLEELNYAACFALETHFLRDVNNNMKLFSLFNFREGHQKRGCQQGGGGRFLSGGGNGEHYATARGW